ncbi:MAG: hypothetical protein NXI04_15360 [Planctomycetaceae bacterium]|nr:hypothetical protein [Planctomycetaceae bacterium]
MRFLLLFVATCLLTNAPTPADDINPSVLNGRQGNRWVVPLSESGPTRIPRVCASLRGSWFEGHPEASVVVHPEIEYWEIRVQGKPVSGKVVLEFDSPPLTPEEIAPVRQAGDGTLTLRCGLGITTGEKLRFEPQPHKNTIGYWTIPTDSVTWKINIDRPGAFNVGALQGAAKNGGGMAKLTLLQGETVVDSLEFPARVTGHFQNFQWQHAGVLNVAQPGDYQVKVEAVKIDRVALMDVRQIHFSPKR